MRTRPRRVVVTWLTTRPLRISKDGVGTYAIRFAFHDIPRWHHFLGVPVAVWLALRGRNRAR